MTAENVNTLTLAFVIVVGIMAIGQYATVKLFVTGKAAWFERRDDEDRPLARVDTTDGASALLPHRPTRR